MSMPDWIFQVDADILQEVFIGEYVRDRGITDESTFVSELLSDVRGGETVYKDLYEAYFSSPWLRGVVSTCCGRMKQGLIQAYVDDHRNFARWLGYL